MAKVTDVFLNGTIGNVAFYRRMGTQCAPSRPLHVKQSAATKIRSGNFGIAARAGKTLRSGLTPSMPNATDRSMQSRFSGAIAKWLGTSGIGELPATDAVPYISALEFTVSIDAFIPSKQISTPAGTGLVTLVISVTGMHLENRRADRQ